MRSTGHFFVLASDQDAAALWELLKAEWRAAAAAGKPLSVEVLPDGRRHTDAQRKRYWAILRQISEQVWTGKRKHAAETWHVFFKQEVLGSAEASTREMTTTEFSDYTARVEALAAEMGAELILEP